MRRQQEREQRRREQEEKRRIEEMERRRKEEEERRRAEEEKRRADREQVRLGTDGRKKKKKHPAECRISKSSGHFLIVGIMFCV